MLEEESRNVYTQDAISKISCSVRYLKNSLNKFINYCTPDSAYQITKKKWFIFMKDSCF